jgi:phosphate starvation-inducible PhoH-like protein
MGRAAKYVQDTAGYEDSVGQTKRSPQNKKNFHEKDLIRILPQTDTQRRVFDAWESGKHLFLSGSAGTGKSFVSLFLQLRELLTNPEIYDKIIICRSIVATRSIGFLPGDIEEKTAVYEKPYAAICDELFPWKKSYDNLKTLGKIEFESTSFVRGRTFNNSLIFVDESENLTFQELDTVITRAGLDSRIIFSGDIKQTDLITYRNDVSGFMPFYNIIRNMPSFACIEFTPKDIVRSGLVKEYLLQKERVPHECV